MSKNKFTWLSIRHLMWLHHIASTPTLIDNGHLKQLSEKGLLEKDANGVWQPTTQGAPYVQVAKSFYRSKTADNLEADALAQLSHRLQTELKGRLTDNPAADPSLSNVTPFARVG